MVTAKTASKRGRRLPAIVEPSGCVSNGMTTLLMPRGRRSGGIPRTSLKRWKMPVSPTGFHPHWLQSSTECHVVKMGHGSTRCAPHAPSPRESAPSSRSCGIFYMLNGAQILLNTVSLKWGSATRSTRPCATLSASRCSHPPTLPPRMILGVGCTQSECGTLAQYWARSSICQNLSRPCTAARSS